MNTARRRGAGAKKQKKCDKAVLRIPKLRKSTIIQRSKPRAKPSIKRAPSKQKQSGLLGSNPYTGQVSTNRGALSSRQVNTARQPAIAMSRDQKIMLEIRRLQASGELMIDQVSFLNLLGEIIPQITDTHHFRPSALRALHESAELYMDGVFTTANLHALYSGRVLLMPTDIQYALNRHSLSHLALAA